MTLRARIALRYIVPFGLILVVGMVLFQVLFERQTMQGLDRRLSELYRDLHPALSFSALSAGALYSFAGQGEMGFEVYGPLLGLQDGQEPELLLSFQLPPGTFQSMAQQGVQGSGEEQGFRFLAFLETELDRYVVVAIDMGHTRQLIASMRIWSWLGLMGAVGLISWWGLRVSRKLLLPLERMGQDMQRISQGEIGGERLDVPLTGSEIARLQDAINRSLQRLENYFQRTRSASSRMAHELRTPLSLVRSTLEVVLLDVPFDDPVRDALEKALADVNRIIRFSGDLLALSKMDQGVMPLRQDVDITRALLLSLEEVMEVFPTKRIEVHLLPSLVLDAKGSEALLERAFFNLLENACLHGEGKNVGVHCTFHGGVVQIAVSSMGPPLSPGLLELIREGGEDPGVFFQGKGNGFGLLIALSILRQHQGKLWVSREELQNQNSFHVQLPASRSAGGE
ncbi:MAG TPA: HAMP domain-containing sensor histidine kinase [Thermotogota bacterium]|nr:HAMP domain-containing sensor histidine kinase [Thermotogota bacterium]